MRTRWLLLIALFFIAGCDNDEINEVYEESNSGTLVQVSVIDALFQGLYDGYYPIGDLLEQGDYGIGTFHQLDGEMVVFNDTVFQVKSTGEVFTPDADVLTPFAAVTKFKADTLFDLSNFSFDTLKTDFDSYFPTQNIFYVVKIKGEFSTIKTRSVPAQSKPYPPLTEVTANQPEFDFENVTGDIIGFYCPAYASGINVTGLHLHFLNSERSGGGHVIDFQLEKGTMQLGYLFDYRLILPEGGDFFGGDFTIDRTGDQEKTE
jgi:acetolactate decarboxylase